MNEFLFRMSRLPRLINSPFLHKPIQYIVYYMHFDRPDESFEFIVWYSSMKIKANGSVRVVIHKPTCMDAILKVLSTIINENRRTNVFTVINNYARVQQRYLLLIKFLYSCDFHFNAAPESN